MSKEYTFNPGDFVVYPAHGVGQVSERQNASIAGKDVDLLAIHFEKDKFTMRIPCENAVNKGLRAVASPAVMETVISTLKSQNKARRQAGIRSKKGQNRSCRNFGPLGYGFADSMCGQIHQTDTAYSGITQNISGYFYSGCHHHKW